jgi:hypothetical protein
MRETRKFWIRLLAALAVALVAGALALRLVLPALAGALLGRAAADQVRLAGGDPPARRGPLPPPGDFRE